MKQNQPDTDKINYSAAEIEQLEKIQRDMALIYNRVAALEAENGDHYEDNSVSGATYIATMRTAMAASASAWMDATDRLHRAKPAP